MKTIIKILIVLLFISCEEDPEKLNVLVLGNSIVSHAPAPELGWEGNWGMAASSKENDFVHLLNTVHNVTAVNISAWENDLQYNTLLSYPEIRGNYDVLVVKFGENVTNLEEYPTAFKRLLETVSYNKLIILNTVWDNNEKDEIHKSMKSDYYIDLKDFRSDSSNFAWGEYINGAIACHPSDKGMYNLFKEITVGINKIK